jgi:septal ring factor EnvC (AmiA/AmiB activator)
VRAAPPAPASGGGNGGAAAGTAPKPAASPDGFPKVDPATQRTRDSDRRRILEDELKKEETRLAAIQKEYNNGEPERQGDERNYQKYLDRVQRLKEDIQRTEGNLATIRRELSALK